MLEIFGLQSWSSAGVALLAGTALGFAYGLIPGLGSRIGLIISIPMAAFFDPYPAAIFLFSLHSVIHTSSSIPAIALGLPSSGADVATVQDGYPLAKMGRAGEALGASLSASAIGGVLGALTFLAVIPIARPLVTSFGPPEILLLAIFGITMVSSVSREGLVQGLVVAAAGALVAIIGVDARTGEQRLTLGALELWDGLKLPALVTGLFVIPEMLAVKAHASDEAQRRAITTTIRDVYKGMFVTLRYKAVLLRSTLYGVLVGASPTVGATVGVWTAYGYAARTTKSDIPFGQGAIAGVIAPEAANNSKEGGAMIPTLFFAIPGSSSMAIMMGALSYAGIAVGPNLLGKDIGVSYTLAATVILANLLAVPAFFLVIPSIVRLSSLKRHTIAPIAVVLSVTAALITEPTLATTAVLLVATMFGIALKRAGWPAAPFVLGFVVEQMAENAYFQTAVIFGWPALLRPITLLLTVCSVLWIVLSIRRQPIWHLAGPKPANFGLLAALLAAFAFGMWLSLPLSWQAGLVPLAVCAFGIVGCLIVLAGAFFAREPGSSPESMHHVRHTAGFILAIPIFGLPAAGFAYVAGILSRSGLGLRPAVITALVFGVIQVGLLSLIFDLPVEREIVGRTFATLFGY